MYLDADVIQLWFHYEEVAMHFNELIIQYRLQLMGGAGAIGALLSYLITTRDISLEQFRMLRAFISSGILLLLISAAILDLYYYNELLRGAVDALIKFEKEHPEIYMSTAIKARFPGNATSIIYLVYGILIVPLAFFTGWSWYKFFTKRNRK